MTSEDGEWHERLVFDNTCGFHSIFGDGNTVSLDLCQHCAREVLGQWLRVTPPADEREAAHRLTALKGSIRKPAKPVSVEDMGTAIAEEAGKAARRLGGLKVGFG